jgi:hypothetical protein
LPCGRDPLRWRSAGKLLGLSGWSGGGCSRSGERSLLLPMARLRRCVQPLERTVASPPTPSPPGNAPPGSAPWAAARSSVAWSPASSTAQACLARRKIHRQDGQREQAKLVGCSRHTVRGVGPGGQFGHLAGPRGASLHLGTAYLYQTCTVFRRHISGEHGACGSQSVPRSGLKGGSAMGARTYARDPTPTFG